MRSPSVNRRRNCLVCFVGAWPRASSTAWMAAMTWAQLQMPQILDVISCASLYLLPLTMPSKYLAPSVAVRWHCLTFPRSTFSRSFAWPSIFVIWSSVMVFAMEHLLQHRQLQADECAHPVLDELLVEALALQQRNHERKVH